MSAEVKSNIDCAIGKVFRAYRKKYNLTQYEIAEKLDISEKYISRLENGNSGVKLETLVNYMNILGIAPNVLFHDVITNDDIKLQVELSHKISELSDKKLKFLNLFLEQLKDF